MKHIAEIVVSILLVAGCTPSVPTREARPSPLAVTNIALSIEEATAGLDGLTIDEFFEESFRLLMLRWPEDVATYGLEERFGVEEPRLNTVSDEYVRQTYRLAEEILKRLRAYDRAALTPEQQVSYDIYEWYLQDLLRGEEFILYDYQATYFFTTSVYGLTQFFFTDTHLLRNRKDAEDYVARLWQVDEKFAGLIDNLRVRQETGIIPPRFVLEWSLPEVRDIASSRPAETAYYQALRDKLDALFDINDGDKEQLLSEAEQAIEQSVIPAYGDLQAVMEEMLAQAPTADGVGQFEGGDAYYAYTLAHHTTTDLTSDEIHALGLKELERIHAEMRAVFDQLGYPQDSDLTQLFSRLADESGYVPGGQVVEVYEQIIDETYPRLDEAFSILPKAKVIVIGAPGAGGFYQSASFDGSRPGAFYATTGSSEPRYGMRTLAYHETIPGHHLQIELAQEMDLPTFRRVIFFNSYAEGWALYAERLTWDLGWYEGDPYGDLGRLQAEAFRATRLVVDTGIHVEGWTFDRAVDFFMENTGFPRSMAENQIARYVVWPGQSTSYLIGMLKFLELRQRTQDRLGDRFDLKEFHQVVLGNGSMPLDILDGVVEAYIQRKLNE